jgi:hypothetical protein
MFQPNQQIPIHNTFDQYSLSHNIQVKNYLNNNSLPNNSQTYVPSQNGHSVFNNLQENK